MVKKTFRSSVTKEVLHESIAVASTFWTNHHTFLSCSAFRLFSLVLNACGPLQQVSLRDTTCRGLLVSWLFFFGSKPGFPEKEVGVAWVAWIGRGGSAVWSTFCASLYNLDSSLASSSGSAEGRALLTAAKSKAERPRSRSPRDERPPISLVRLHRQHPHVEESENLARKAFIQKVRRVKKKIRHETPQ